MNCLLNCCRLVLVILACLAWSPGGFANHSLRFYGNGSNDIDRVKVSIDPPVPIDVGGDFTLEFWIKALPGANTSTNISEGGDAWIFGNIIFDRDVFGSGDFGDYGVSLGDGRIKFGVDRLGTGHTITGTTAVDDGDWHHIAVTRHSTSGQLNIFVDGQLDRQGTGPTGDISYRDGRITTHPGSDPFLVIGAEKHDAGSAFPSLNGWLDEVRISSVVRYTGAFPPPRLPFLPDPDTVGLYHFDAGTGAVVHDTSGAAGGPSNGTREVGGSPVGPQWTTDIPFDFGPVAMTSTQLASGLSSPVGIETADDDSGRLFVVEQPGQIKVYSSNQVLATSFLDISAIVRNVGNEEGLLGLAFHPGYQTNGHFFVYYTISSGNSNVVARYTASPPDTNVVNTNTAMPVISIVHTNQSNHNGGQIRFGPDGYLYIGPGDGGGSCDPFNNGQDTDTFLGKLLRIDIDSGSPYANPISNPFVGVAGADEIWAYGLRNPWRFSFDRLTDELFIGDVGQNAREEINFQPAASIGGENYGWECIEGTLTNPCGNNCVSPGMIPPIIEYAHGVTGCRSVTGGYRYRGYEVPPLCAAYLYADYCTGDLSAAWKHTTGTWTNALLVNVGFGLSSFGEDECGELYYVNRSSGRFYKIVAVDTDGDGLPDWWERVFFGNATAGDPNQDSDGDGFTNGAELAAWTDPLNPKDSLRATPTIAGDDVVVRFKTVYKKRYRVEVRGDLDTGSWTAIPGVVEGTGGIVAVTDTGAAGNSKRFYRVVLVQ